MYFSSLEGKLALLLVAAAVVAAALAAALTAWTGNPWLGAVVVIVGLMGPLLWLAHTAMQPVRRLLRALSGSVASYRDGDFSISLRARRRDELGQLIEAHNELGHAQREQRRVPRLPYRDDGCGSIRVALRSGYNSSRSVPDAREERVVRKLVVLLLGLVVCGAAQAAMRTRSVDYTVGGKAMQGVLVWNDAVKTPRPGLLMIPDWTGINPRNIDFAKSIAGKKYVIFVGDMYGKAVRPANGAEARAASKPLVSNRELLRVRVDAAFDEMKTLAARHAAPIDTSRLAAIGFCFGGTSVLALARSGADVAAVVSFHGGLSTDNPALAKHIKARVLAMNGADDRSTMPDAPAFLKHMRVDPSPWQFVAFGGAVHCFSEPWAHSPGCRYDPPVAKRAFALMHRWLAQAFAH